MTAGKYRRRKWQGPVGPERPASPSEPVACPPVAAQDHRGWLFAIGQALRVQYETPTDDLPPRLAALIAKLEKRE
jgi:hypothetical protein